MKDCFTIKDIQTIVKYGDPIEVEKAFQLRDILNLIVEERTAEGFLALQKRFDEKVVECDLYYKELVENRAENEKLAKWVADGSPATKDRRATVEVLEAENERLREALTDICEQLAPGTDWGSSMCDTINDIARAALKPQGKGEG